MQNKLNKLLVTFGFSSVSIIVIGAFLTALAYVGDYGQSYSIFNHYISELGELKNSEWAMLFNNSLIVGGVLLIGFMLLLGLTLKHWFAWIASLLGIYAAANCALVGLYPMDNLELHGKVAMDFFFYGMIAVGLFTIYFFFFAKEAHPRQLGIPGVIAAASFASFLYIPEFTLSAPGEARQPFLLITSLEWLVFFSVLAWVVVVSFYFRKKITINQK